jgi:hypothetical protein
MRKFVPLLSLVAAGCATAPQETPPAGNLPVTPSPHVTSSVLGLTANELTARLGSPALRVSEGAGLKLQFRSPYCVLDAYLYPPENGQGLTRVTHSDARLLSGVDTDQAACIRAIEARN